MGRGLPISLSPPLPLRCLYGERKRSLSLATLPLMGIGEEHPWWFCKTCNRVWKYNQKNLKKHSGCGIMALRLVSNEPFWHMFYAPGLLLSWFKGIRVKWSKLR